MNAIELLKEDHRRVSALFTEHDATGENALVEKRTVAERIFKELHVHTQIEEEIFYPAARDGATHDTEKLLAEAYEEHQVAKTLIAELESLAPGGEQWDAKMKVLKESIEHHVKEEQEELFPKVREALGTSYLEEVGERMAARKHELMNPGPGLGGSLVKLVTRAYDSLTGNGKPAPRARASKAANAKVGTAKKKRVASAKRVTGTTTKRTAQKAVSKAGATARKRKTVAKSSAARSARAVSPAKKVAARGKKSLVAGRARVAKVVKTARQAATKRRRSARR